MAGGKGREGCGKETWSAKKKVIKKQVEEEGRVVDPQSWRRLMDKRTCESMLGVQSHCQTHRRQRHEEEEEHERETRGDGEREREGSFAHGWRRVH